MLYAIVQLLKMAKLPEAAEVEQLRKTVLGIGQAPPQAPGVAQAARVLAPCVILPYCWYLC